MGFPIVTGTGYCGMESAPRKTFATFVEHSVLGDHRPMLTAAFSLIQAAWLSLPASASTLTKMGSLNKASVRVPPEGLPYLSAFSEGLELSLLLGKTAQLHNLSVAQQTCLGRGENREV